MLVVAFSKAQATSAEQRFKIDLLSLSRRREITNPLAIFASASVCKGSPAMPKLPILSLPSLMTICVPALSLPPDFSTSSLVIAESCLCGICDYFAVFITNNGVMLRFGVNKIRNVFGSFYINL